MYSLENSYRIIYISYTAAGLAHVGIAEIHSEQLFAFHLLSGGFYYKFVYPANTYIHGL